MILNKLIEQKKKVWIIKIVPNTITKDVKEIKQELEKNKNIWEFIKKSKFQNIKKAKMKGMLSKKLRKK